MSRKGHVITGAAMAAAGLVMMDGFTAALFAAGCLAGATAPDWMEVTWFRGGRQSLIPHRTLTHWPWPWALVLLLATLLQLEHTVAWLLIGFAGGGLLHLAVDICTPAGIPLGHPAGKRLSLNIYRTGGPGEIVVALAAWLLPAMLLVIV